MQAEEWDWPPRHNRPLTPIEGRIQAGRIILPRQGSRAPAARSFANRLASAFSAAIFGLFRLALILALMGVLFASLSLIGAILKA